MNPKSEGQIIRCRGHESRPLRSLAIGGLIVSVVVVALAVMGSLLWQRDGDEDVAAGMAPSQSEPETGFDPFIERDGSPPPAAQHRDIELAGHAVDALDTEANEADTVPHSGPSSDAGVRPPGVPFYSSSDLDELQIAEAAAAHGKWEEAARAYAEITMNPPVPIDVWYHRAIACLKIGDQTAYRQICESLLDRVEMNPLNLPPINLVAWMCAVGPEGVADHRRPVVLAELLLPRLPDNPTARHAYLNTIGGVFLRAGRYDEAVKHLKQGIAATDDGGAKQDWLLLALAYHHLGRPTEARRCLASIPAESPLNRRESIWDTAEIELLRDEVERTLTPRQR